MRHLSESSKERAIIKYKIELLLKSLSEEDFYHMADEDSEDDIEKVGGLKEDN